jgi:hypothetical protein
MKTLLFGLIVTLVLATAMIALLASATFAELKGWVDRRRTGSRG